MIAEAEPTYQNQSGANPADQDGDKEIIVIGKRLSTSPSSGGGGGRGAIIVNIGGINGSENDFGTKFTEFLRALIVDVTDFDIDPNFTAKQREIILKAIRGLADHLGYGDKMAELIAKGADINIVTDFVGKHTFDNKGILEGRNDDGTVDRGESLTIYINMNPEGAPITDRALANTIVHELMHVFGDPALDALLDVRDSIYDRGPTRDIFWDYDYEAPAVSGTAQADIIRVPIGGGAVAGGGDYAIFNGPISRIGSRREWVAV